MGSRGPEKISVRLLLQEMIQLTGVARHNSFDGWVALTYTTPYEMVIEADCQLFDTN